jgi:hypothetical protein
MILIYLPTALRLDHCPKHHTQEELGLEARRQKKLKKAFLALVRVLQLAL